MGPNIKCEYVYFYTIVLYFREILLDLINEY